MSTLDRQGAGLAETTAEPKKVTHTCSHHGCSCRVGPANGRRQEQYCSSGCAIGEGCSHPDCNCAAYHALMRGE